jgi:Uma2 family endonuclease
MSTVTPRESTITATPIEPADPGWIPSPLYRFSLERYEELVESGAFTTRDRFHLINGYLVARMTQNPPHNTADDLCGAALQRVMPPGWYIRAAKPVRIPNRVSKPEPDRAIVRGSIRDYARRDPDPSEVALVVEVADSSLRDDRELARVYGGGGIPVYWIINLVDRQVEVYTLPDQGGYRSQTIFQPGQDVPVVIGGVEVARIPVDDLLP